MNYAQIISLLEQSPELIGDFIVLLTAIQTFLAKVKAAQSTPPVMP
jgi:hypothetical protein